MKLGRLLLRLVVGGFFVGHGTQKLFGWFGGHGLDATGSFFEHLGLRPGKRHALAAGAAEAGGGTLIALGAATPLAASVLTATMLTAINRVHLRNGPWVTNGGYEYNVVLIAAVLALTETGPGSPSVDDGAAGSRSTVPGGPRWRCAGRARRSRRRTPPPRPRRLPKPPAETGSTARRVPGGSPSPPRNRPDLGPASRCTATPAITSPTAASSAALGSCAEHHHADHHRSRRQQRDHQRVGRPAQAGHRELVGHVGDHRRADADAHPGQQRDRISDRP